MDRDVELSMNQAHDKWITRTLVMGFIVFTAMTGATCAYEEHESQSAAVQRAHDDALRAHDEALKAMWDHQK